MFQSPEKMEDDPLPRSPQPLSLGKSKMSHRISPLGIVIPYFSRKAEKPPGMSHWPGRTAVLARVSGAPSPCDKPCFSCLSPLHQLPRLSSLTLPQHYAIMEKKKKKSDHEIGLKFSVYTWCPVALCFQMKMLCMTEESQ